MPYGAWCSTDSTGPMSPRSILNTSAIAQVHGIFGPLSARSAISQRAEARVAARVVEECEREREAALGVDDDEAPIANACDVEEHARAELLEAADLWAVRPAASARAHERGVAGQHHAVLEPRAIGRERVVALAVVALDAAEVGVADSDELGARQPLGGRDGFGPG